MTETPTPTQRQPSRRLGTGWPTHPALFEQDTTKVVIAGDWHGSTAWGMKVLAEAALIGASTVIVAGDHGGLWPGDHATLRKWNQQAARHQVRLGLVPGNHDWHPKLDAIPRGPDGFARLDTWVWHIPRPTRWQVGSWRFAALGGAHSVDWQRRVPGKSWWAEELITEEHVAELGTDPLDVLITHEAPCRGHLRSSMNLSALNAAASDHQRDLLARAVRATRPKMVFHGHWHQRTTGHFVHPDGFDTTVFSLGMQWEEGNWVELDLVTGTVTERVAALRRVS